MQGCSGVVFVHFGGTELKSFLNPCLLAQHGIYSRDEGKMHEGQTRVKPPLGAPTYTQECLGTPLPSQVPADGPGKEW